MARNSGSWVNVTALTNLTAGKEGAEDALKRFLETGIGLFKETNGMNIRNSNLKPSYEFEGGMGRLFQEIQLAFGMNLNMVEMVTGISPLSLGSVDPNAPVGTSELSYQNTQDTLRPILLGYSNIKKNLSRNTALWINLKVKNDPEAMEAYREIIGEAGIKTLLIASKSNAQYGIHTSAQPSELEKSKLLTAAEVSLANGRDGKPGINISQYFTILRIINSNGSLKLAEHILSNAIARSEDEADKRAKENMQIQQQGAIKIKQEETAKELRKIEAQKNADIETEYAKSVFQVMVANPIAVERDKQMMQLKAYYDSLLKQTAIESTGAQPQTQPAM